MLAEKTVAVGGTSYRFFTARGQVLGSKKGHTTHVTGNAKSVSSRTEVHDQFVLREPDGRERSVQVSGADLVLRDGHESPCSSASRGRATTGHISSFTTTRPAIRRSCRTACVPSARHRCWSSS